MTATTTHDRAVTTTPALLFITVAATAFAPKDKKTSKKVPPLVSEILFPHNHTLTLTSARCVEFENGQN